MKKDSTFVSRLCLVFGDIFAIIFSFFGAYYFRTHLDSRPFFFVSDSKGFLLEIILLIPVWILILGSLGLYSKNILARHARAKESGRLRVASIVGLRAMISVD